MNFSSLITATGSLADMQTTVVDSVNKKGYFIRNSKTILFNFAVVARSQDGTQHARFDRQGMATCDDSGVASFVGVTTPLCSDNNDPGWQMVVYIDVTLQTLFMDVVGAPPPLWLAQMSIMQLPLSDFQ